MSRKTITAILLLFALVGLPAFANASISTFSGQDDGAPTSGPFPSSTAAQASFGAAAGSFGPLSTITFESQALGFSTPFTAAPGVTVSLSASNFGDGFSGISTTTFGNLYGFNTTPGGSKWLGFPDGSATFSFASPTHSFGMFLTGVQTIFTSSLTVNFNDGASQTLSLPINVNGGAQYYGFTDTIAISSITITNISNDAWGIDDVTYNRNVPEPCTLLLLGSGLVGLAAFRKKSRA